MEKRKQTARYAVILTVTGRNMNWNYTIRNMGTTIMEGNGVGYSDNRKNEYMGLIRGLQDSSILKRLSRINVVCDPIIPRQILANRLQTDDLEVISLHSELKKLIKRLEKSRTSIVFS